MSSIDTSGIDITKPVEGTPTTQSVRDNTSAIKTQLENAASDIDGKQASSAVLTNLSSTVRAGYTFTSKANAAAFTFTSADAGRKVFITSDDGGEFTIEYNATPSTYADDGGSYCGTQFIPSGGDGTIGIVRDYDGVIKSVWYGKTTPTDSNSEPTYYVDPATSKVQSGDDQTDFKPYDSAVLGANDIQISRGDSTPVTFRHPLVQLTKFTEADDSGLWDQGGLTAKSRTTAGASPCVALTGHTIRSGTSTGDVVGIHGRVETLTSTGPSPGNSAYAGWFYAVAGAASSGSGHITGIEVDVYNLAGDSGHFDSGVPLVTDTFTTGYWAFNDNAPTGGELTAAYAFGAGTNAQWHSGFLCKNDSITPFDGSSVRNEVIMLHGGTTSAKRYGGIRFGDTGSNDYFHYGIRLNEGTYQNSSAIQLGDTHQIQLGNSTDSAIQWTGSHLRLSTTSGNIHFQPTNVANNALSASNATSAVNGLLVTGEATGNGVSLNAQGTDTNIDMKFVPKGSGVIQFGSHTALGAETLSGYITIKDSGGTSRKIAVIS